MADAKLYSPKQLRKFKKKPNKIRMISNKFDWLFSECMIKVGNNFVMGNEACFPLKKPFLSIAKEGGLRVISLVLTKEDGTIAARLDKNLLSCDTSLVKDIRVSASSKEIAVKLKNTKIDFRMTYDRLTHVEFDKVLGDSLNIQEGWTDRRGKPLLKWQEWSDLRDSNITASDPDSYPCGMLEQVALVRHQAKLLYDKEDSIPLFEIDRLNTWYQGENVLIRAGVIQMQSANFASSFANCSFVSGNDAWLSDGIKFRRRTPSDWENH